MKSLSDFLNPQPRAALLAMALCALPAFTVMADELRAVGGGAYQSTDSEGFRSRRLSADAIGSYAHLDSKLGLRYTDYDFSRGSWSRRGEQLRLVAHRLDRQTLAGWSLESGLFRAAGHDLWTLDAVWRQALSPGRSVELFANRDFVETANAIDRGIAFDFAGASADIQLAERWTVVGLAGLQHFSDGNRRRHARARLVFQPWTDVGFTTQLRYRWFDSSKDDVARAYFNPGRYQETMLAVGWRHRAGDWRNALTAGLGRQRINDDPETSTQLLEASAEQQLRSYALRLRGGYLRSASLASADPDYWYRYLSVDLIVPF